MLKTKPGEVERLLETAGLLPKATRETVEDEVAHILSEHLNDNAPIGEERYRPAAQGVLKLVREALLAEIGELWLAPFEGTTKVDSGAWAAAQYVVTRFEGVISHLLPEPPVAPEAAA